MSLVLALLFLLISIAGISLRISDAFVYIYEDLPPDLKDTWPPANMSGKSVNNSIFRQSMRENRGYGTLIDQTCGMYNTWQVGLISVHDCLCLHLTSIAFFLCYSSILTCKLADFFTSLMFTHAQFSVFKAIYQRLLVSPMRTLDPSKASVFFLPYDGGIDALVSSYDGRLIKFKCPRSGPAKSFLSGQEYFKRNSGKDHFLIFSVIQGVSSLNSPGCRGLYKDLCQHCTKLTIEVSYHADIHSKQTVVKQTADTNLSSTVFIDPSWPEWKKKNRERKSLGLTGGGKGGTAYTYDPTWTSIPYPSSFHYFDGIQNIPWRYDENLVRNATAVFVGGGKTTNLPAKMLRDRLKNQCALRDNCKWVATGKDRAHVNLASALGMYRNSIFCLNPPGDSPTRKGLFDSLLAGCIPVVFDKYTLEDQYPWHIGVDRIESISVYIPIEEMIGKQATDGADNNSKKRRKKHRKFDELSVGGNLTNFMDHLEQISPDRVKQMQKSIGKIADSLQYSIPPKSASEQKRWQPPFKDSVDIIVEKMIEKAKSLTTAAAL